MTSTKAKYVREYDLDAPTLPKEERNHFRYRTRNVTNLFETFAGKIPTQSGAWKILVEVVETLTRKQPINLLGVLVVQVQSDPLQLLTCSSEESRELSLKWLLIGLRHVSRSVGVGFEDFAEVGDRVVQVGFRNRRRWLGPVRSPNRKLKAEIEVDFGDKEAVLIGVVRRLSGELISEAVLTRTKPDEFLFVPLLGRLRWKSDGVVELHSKSNGVIEFSAE